MTRTALIGAGGMARRHLPLMIETGAELRVICEPSSANYEDTVDLLQELGAPPPPNEPDLATLLDRYAAALDAVFIVTPHNLHHDQAKICMEAGLDVLLEKPMVMNAKEALSLMETHDRTGKLLVVAFQGGLSPQIREAARLIQSGELGRTAERDRHGLAGLERSNGEFLASNTGSRGRRIYVRYGRAHAQYALYPGRRGLQDRRRLDRQPWRGCRYRRCGDGAAGIGSIGHDQRLWRFDSRAGFGDFYCAERRGHPHRHLRRATLGPTGRRNGN